MEHLIITENKYIKYIKQQLSNQNKQISKNKLSKKLLSKIIIYINAKKNFIKRF
jgi:hypothetical protein